jgi:carbonic anhydrase
MDLKELASGWAKFKQDKFPTHKGQITELATRGTHATHPMAIITCVDPRVNLPWITQQDAGKISQHQTLGAIIPPYGLHSLSEEAFLDYAIAGFKSKHLAIIGHTGCAMVKALIEPHEAIVHMPAVFSWAHLAKDTTQAVFQRIGHLTDKAKWDAAVEIHTLLQVQHAMSYPVVREAVEAGELTLHPLVYKLETADLLQYSKHHGRFELLASGAEPSKGAKPHVCHSACLHTL